MKIINEATMRFLEEHIPELADSAIKQAYWRALASGTSVLECEGGALVEVHPDGTRKIIRQLQPYTPVKLGQKLEIR
jgi:hypothetical protein